MRDFDNFCYYYYFYSLFDPAFPRCLSLYEYPPFIYSGLNDYVNPSRENAGGANASGA